MERRPGIKNIYVVTHAQAQHHLANVVGGWHDSDLSEHGRTQAAAVAHALRALIPEDAATEVHSSDLARARQTATPIAGALEVSITASADLRELSYGEAEGRPQSWLDERFVPAPATGERMLHDCGIPGSETKHTFATRIYRAVERIVGSPCAHQVIVTHGYAMTFVVAAWTGMPIEAAGYVNYRASAAGITHLQEDDFHHNRSVLRLNDTAHLGPA